MIENKFFPDCGIQTVNISDLQKLAGTLPIPAHMKTGKLYSPEAMDAVYTKIIELKQKKAKDKNVLNHIQKEIDMNEIMIDGLELKLKEMGLPLDYVKYQDQKRIV